MMTLTMSTILCGIVTIHLFGEFSHSLFSIRKTTTISITIYQTIWDKNFTKSANLFISSQYVWIPRSALRLCSSTFFKLLSQITRLQFHRISRRRNIEEYFIPNIFFGIEIAFVVSIFPWFPLLIESNIKGQCTTECKCKNDEKQNRLHLNVIIIIRNYIWSLVTHLRCIKHTKNFDSLITCHKLLYCRLSYLTNGVFMISLILKRIVIIYTCIVTVFFFLCR
jgi:hypothetical protein